MSYCLSPTAVDLDTVRRAIGSKDKKLLVRLKKSIGNDLDQIDAMLEDYDDEDEEEEPLTTADVLRHMILGEPYRDGDGLVVVDYKTSATDDAAELDRRIEGYRLQGASYALTIAAATGESVTRVTFLFLTPNGPVERDLDDLDAAIDRVRALVTAGQEITVDESEAAS